MSQVGLKSQYYILEQQNIVDNKFSFGNKMEQEVSKRITAIILIIAIIISTYLTLLAFKYRATLNQERKVGNTVQSAEVRLTVVAPESAEMLEGNVTEEGGVG